MENLTIAIPTFNRSKYLLKTLTTLSKYKNYGRLNILICDNCSTDNTKFIVEHFIEKSKWDNVSYHQNSYNMGFDANVLTSYLLCKSE